MKNTIRFIFGIIVIIAVVVGVYFYAIPKGATTPQSAISSEVLKKPAKYQLTFTPAPTAAREAQYTGYIQQGSNSAPAKFYAILDPNCIWCHHLFQEMQPFIAEDKVAARWIVIGAVRPSSPGKAKAILASPSPIAALRLNENTFKLSLEEGGITPAYHVPEKVLRQFDKNMAFVRMINLRATPVILFYSQSGQLIRHDGGVPKDKMKELVSHFGNHF